MKPTFEELVGGDKCPLGEFHEGRTYQLVRHDRRIAALEAELAEYRRPPSDDWWRRWPRKDLGERVEFWGRRHAEAVVRAEKAEAEVERLRKLIVAERGLSSVQRDALDVQGRNLEKAEAEVERLKSELALQRKATQDWADAWEDIHAVRVRLLELVKKGGGRESGPAGSPVETRETVQTRTAANPAAPRKEG